MSKPELEQIVTASRQIQDATTATLNTIKPWMSWNLNITQGRELGDQIIALAGLVAQLAQQVELLSSEKAGASQSEGMNS